MNTPDQPVKPTILFVQGAFQQSLVYTPLVECLTSKGYPTVYPALPSCTNISDPGFPSTSLIDDAHAIRLELIRLIEYESKAVVVVMHSYGGLVGSEAISEDLTAESRKQRGLNGGVVHLFFFSAFLLEVGQSVSGVFGESPNNDVRPDGRMYIKNGAKNLYNDLPEAEALLWESRLTAQSWGVQNTKLTRAPYKTIPTTYLICENDQAVPPQYQESFAKMANADIDRCSAGHSPQLSQTEMLAGKIGNVVDQIK